MTWLLRLGAELFESHTKCCYSCNTTQSALKMYVNNKLINI